MIEVVGPRSPDVNLDISVRLQTLSCRHFLCQIRFWRSGEPPNGVRGGFRIAIFQKYLEPEAETLDPLT